MYKTDKSDGIRIELTKVKKLYKQKIFSAQKEYDAKFHKELRGLKKSQPQAYWKVINSSNGMKENKIPIEIGNLQEHFRNLSQTSKENTEYYGSQFGNIASSNKCLNRAIDIEEVFRQIKRLKNGKAHGEDMIINEFFKFSTKPLLSIIVKLFNVVLESGIVPMDWTIGLICPLYKKKGNPSDPNNYRGITLLSCLGKLFTAVLNERLTSYLEDNNYDR